METNITEPPTRTHIKGKRNYLLHHNHHRHHHHHRQIHLETTLLAVLVPIVIVVLVIAISLIVAFFRRVKSPKPNGGISKGNKSCMFTAHSIITFNGTTDMKRGCIHGGSPCSLRSATTKGVQVFTYKELQSATDDFNQNNLMCKGGSGNVYRGMLRDGTLSAIKVLHRDGKQGERVFRLEVLSWGTRLRIALDCAKALEFLHEHTTPSVIHHDFKSMNILLNENFRGKVSDFGMAKIGSDKLNGMISTRVLGTTGYLAPEYASTGKLTTKSDVYSYVVEMVDPNLHGQFSRKDLIQVAAIAAMCVQTAADYRPLMTDVVQSLIPIVHNISFGCSTSSFRFSKRISPRS
ncbi:hypothetical protein L1987_74528 [Smallanthus sonchifolius]|uniref:Uncharacterized protein n=1 Tax=Smallanthus sonchifolius TaxID=185202 RepID=A0ACB9A3K5_9ASTR|nr:hypothetical protein L1987_74528 [Smallanthus sonchifolius]